MFGIDPPGYRPPRTGPLATIGPDASAGIFARPAPPKPPLDPRLQAMINALANRRLASYRPPPEPLMPLVSATGWSGQRFQVRPFKIGTVFPVLAGVYIWCWQRTNGNWFPLYVGQADDLNDRLTKRLRQHQCYLRAMELGVTHIAAMHAADKTLRLQIETDLRRSLDPPLNRQ